MCDTEFSNITRNSTLNAEIGTRTISVFVDPHGSLNCTAKQMFKGHSAVNSTHGPSDTLHSTTGEHFAVSLLEEFVALIKRILILVCLVLQVYLQSLNISFQLFMGHQ